MKSSVERTESLYQAFNAILSGGNEAGRVGRQSDRAELARDELVKEANEQVIIDAADRKSSALGVSEWLKRQSLDQDVTP